MKIEVVCSWCQCHMGWKECACLAPAEIPHPITHSICPECLQKELAEITAMSLNKTNE